MEIENLKAKIDDMKANEETHLIDREKLYYLFEKWVIDEKGMPINKFEEDDMK